MKDANGHFLSTHVAGLCFAVLVFCIVHLYASPIFSTVYLKYWNGSVGVGIPNTPFTVLEYYEHEYADMEAAVVFARLDDDTTSYLYSAKYWFNDGVLGNDGYYMAASVNAVHGVGIHEDAFVVLEIQVAENELAWDYYDLNWNGAFDLVCHGSLPESQQLWAIVDGQWLELRTPVGEDLELKETGATIEWDRDLDRWVIDGNVSSE